MKNIFLTTALTFTLAAGSFAMAQTMAPSTMSSPATMAPVMKSDLNKHKAKALPANSMAPNGTSTATAGADPMKGNLAKAQ
jgi:hypothetical protein